MRDKDVGCAVMIAALLALTPLRAGAQVEIRCPPGWSRADNVVSLRPTPHPKAREALAHCFGGPGTNLSFEVDQLDAPLPSEAEWARRRLPDIASPATFRDERFAGLRGAARSLEWVHVTPAAGHHQQTITFGRAVLLRVGASLVSVVSSDVATSFSWTAPEHAATAEAHRRVIRAFIESIVGLDGSTARWNARAECPTGTAPAPDGLQLVRGWRRVVRCRSADGFVDVEVRESRVPISDDEAARREAALASQILPWASAEPTERLLRSVRGTSVGTQRVYSGSLAWPVARDMGRDDRPQRARFAIAVLPTASGNVQVGWLARDASSGGAVRALGRWLPTLMTAGTAGGAPSTVVVVARVIQSGPVGDGRCSQCSHQVTVLSSDSPAIPAGGAPLWVHFEHCAGAPPPPDGPGLVAPCSLRVGQTYRLTLGRGGSAGFGDAPMILEARASSP